MDSRENPTTPLGMPTYLDRSSFTGPGLTHADWSLCSGVDWSLASPFTNCFLELLCPTLWPAFPSYFRSPEISSPKLFVWFHAKTDKGIVCLADHLHSVTKLSEDCFKLSREYIPTIKNKPVKSLGNALITPWRTQ